MIDRALSPVEFMDYIRERPGRPRALSNLRDAATSYLAAIDGGNPTKISAAVADVCSTAEVANELLKD